MADNKTRCRPPGSDNPTSHPCRTCYYFDPDNGWCSDIESDVKEWWTGCIRHSPKKQLVRVGG
jgi:hypothetical protein